MNILITGASGFVGKALVEKCFCLDHDIFAVVRKPFDEHRENIRQIICRDLSLNKSDAYFSLCQKMTEVETVIHTAARVHVMNDNVSDPLAEFREVNTEATINLAQQAANAGVKRFIFISSVKVNGEQTELNHPFTPDKNEEPKDPYGLSKYEAEQGLLAIAKETGMEVVIIRPPLVYGASVRANFASMIKWVNKGIPLPFGAIHNRRSLVALDNLVDFIIHCIEHPKAANEVFLISDGEDVSTTELLRKVSKAFGKKSRLIPVPVWLMTLAAKLIGKGDVANRLFGSLQVDSSKARDLLGWEPVITMDEQLKKTADAYLENEKNL